MLRQNAGSDGAEAVLVHYPGRLFQDAIFVEFMRIGHIEQCTP
jgi:hypothetical protein